MIQTRVIPLLLLDGNRLVKTVRFSDPVYVGDPLNTVRIFNEKTVDELILADIGATKERRAPNYELISRVASQCFMPLCYGGGVSDVDQARRIFELGVEKVALNTAAVKEPGLVAECAAAVGSQSIVASLDVKRSPQGGWEVWVAGGTEATGRNVLDAAQQLEEAGAGELLLTSIDLDGTQRGFDLELIRTVCADVDIPVIACGGAGDMNDFREAAARGASAVAAGSMFVFFGKSRSVLINYPERERLLKLFETL